MSKHPITDSSYLREAARRMNSGTTEAQARVSYDYKKIESRNQCLTREQRDAQQASGYCTYPNCKCPAVQTSTTQPSPDCPRGLADLPAPVLE